MSRLLSRSCFVLVVLSALCSPLHAQLNFNSGNFGTLSFGQAVLSFDPSGGTGPYTFSYAPGASIIPGFRVTNRPDVPVWFGPNTTGALVGIATPDTCAPTGNCSTTIRLSDANGFIDRVVSFSVTSVDIGGSTFSGYGVGDRIDFRFWGVGGSGSYTFTLDSGTLPPGTQIHNQAGAFTGISVDGVLTTAGGYNFSLKLTDSANHSVTRGYFVSVSPLHLVQDRILPAANVGLFYSQTLTVTGCTGTCTFSVDEAIGLLPTGFTLSPAGVLSGTPTFSSFFNNFTLIITDGINTIRRRMQLTSLPVTPTPLTVSTTSVSDVVVGSGSFPGISGSGGFPPYSFSLDSSSSLPAGAFILPAAALGPEFNPLQGYVGSRVLAAGDHDFVIRIIDSANNTATRPLPWRVTNLTTNQCCISTAVFGVPLTPYALVIMGGTPPYTVAPNTIAAGLTTDNNAIISGTPKEIGQFLTLNLTIQDSANPKNSFTLSGYTTITASPTSTGLLVSGGDFGPLQKGVQTAFSISASGSSALPRNFTVSIQEGSLPPGMTLLTGNNFNNSGNVDIAAQIAGVPTVAGVYSVLLRVQDGAGNIGQRQIRIRVSSLAFVTSTLAVGSVGIPYNQTIEFRGGQAPYTLTLTNGSLPTGLSLNGPTISGTPTTSNSTFAGIRITDATGDSIIRNFTLNIYSLQITNPNILPTAYFGEVYSPVTFVVSPPGSYTWTAVGIPLGLTLDSTTGVLSGTPISSGSFNITVTAGTSSTVVVKTFTMFIAVRSTTGVLTGLPSTFGDVFVGSTLTTTLGVSGGTPPYTIALAPGSILPPGLAIVPATSINGNAFFGRYFLAGVLTTAGDYSFRLRYTDGAGLTVDRTITMRVVSIGVATTSLGLGTVNVPYSTQLFGVGGSGPFTFSLSNIANNILPPGLTLSSSGVVSGTPTSTGSFGFTVDLTDGVSTRQQSVVITINATSDLRRIDFGTVIPVTLSMGRGFATTFVPINGSGTHTWSIVSGSLPPGLLLRADATLPSTVLPPNALIAGVPTTAGTYKFTVRVDDQTGNFGTREMTYRITPLRAGPANLPQTRGLVAPPLQAGVPYSFGLTAYNNTGPVTFGDLVGTFMPSGVAMNSTGVVSGTAADLGNFTELYVMTDGAGSTFPNGALGFVVYPSGRPIGVNGLTGATFANATKGSAYSKNLNDLLFPGYGTPPFTWAVLNGSLPAGMSILGSVLTGTPTDIGTSFFSLKVTDANGSQHVVPNQILSVSLMSLTPGPGILPPAIAGVPYSQTFTPAGGVPPVTFRLGLGSDLPVGLTLSSAGVLSGTPTTSGPFILLIEAVDNFGATFLQRYTLDVAPVGTVLPSLKTTPSSINLNYVRGNPNPTPITVNVESTSGNLNFTAQTAGGTWISVAPGSGSTPGFVTLSFNMAGLLAGIYNGALNVTAASAVNSPLSLPVKLTVTDALPCSFALNPTASTIAAGGGSLSFDVTTDSSCNWTASTAVPWITINSPGSGTGTGTVNLSVQQNPNPTTRTGTVTVQGLIYTVTQFGTECSFTLIPNSINVDAFGGIGTINVQASNAVCSWTTAQTDLWIAANPSAGTGSTNVDVTVQSTSGTSSRVGSITIAGQALTVNQAGLGCFYFLSNSQPNPPQFSSSGGGASVDLTTPAGCAWKTDPGPSWIKVTAGQSGFSSGRVTLTIAPNSSTVARSATVLIADQEYDVSQDGVSCSFSVGVDNTLFAVGGGAGNVVITATPKVAGGFCPWVVSSNGSWLTPSVSSGNGSQTVSFNVSANGGTAARSATLNVAGQNIVITESGPVCEFSLRSSAATMPFGGGANSAGVVTANGCGWTATSNAPFITVAPVSSSGTGTGDVNFDVQPNSTGTSRIGTLTIAGQTFTVTQAKAPCSIILGSSSFNVGPFGGTGSFSYTSSVNSCEHTVLSYSSMVTVTSTSYSGTAGTVNFSVEPNGFAAARSGVIRVGEESFTVNQDPSTCQYTLTAFSASFDRLGGPGSIPMTFAPAACGPAGALVKGPASMITLGDVLKDGGTYNQTFSTGIYQSFINYIRTAQIIINGQIFTVKQTSW